MRPIILSAYIDIRKLRDGNDYRDILSLYAESNWLVVESGDIVPYEWFVKTYECAKFIRSNRNID